MLKSYATSERQSRVTDETNADARRSRDRGKEKGRNDAEQRSADQRRDQKSRAQRRVAQRDESRTEAQRLKPAEFRAMNEK